jgi:hypothetical protein
MKRIPTLAIVLLLAASAAAESVTYSTLVPKTAKSMAMGGIFTAVHTTEFSFFGNPAAFASEKAGLIIPGLDAWAYIRPTGGNLGDLATAKGGDMLAKVFGLMSQNGGSGGGASAGIGYAGRGLGLGLFLTSDDYIEGTSPAGAVIHSDTQAMAVMGMGVPITLGDLKLSVGGDLRPFYRVRLADATGQAPALADLLAQGSSGLYSDAFFGAAMDLGASLKLGDFSFGLSIRDIAPAFPIATGTFAELQSSLASGSLPDTSSAVDQAVLSPALSAGLAWAPKLLPGRIDPALYFELQDPVKVVRQWNGVGSALNLLHAGAELTFFKMLSLRGGLNRGWLSAGAGHKLLFLDLDAAIFTEELGPLPGDHPRSGISLQAALRF